MKAMRKAFFLFLALCLTAAVLAGCGSDGKTNTTSTNSTSSTPSVVSTESIAESSDESPEPSEEAVVLKVHTTNDMSTIVRNMDIGSFIGYSAQKGVPTLQHDNLLMTTANMKFSGTHDDLKKFLAHMVKFEEENVYVTSVKIEPSGDVFKYSVDIEAPYVRDGSEISNNELKKIMRRYSSADRIKLIDAFLAFHDEYSYEKVFIKYFLTDDDNASADMEKNFNNYNGFLSYQEAVIKDGNFKFDEAVSIEKTPVDGDTITYVEYTLVSDKFNRI